MLAATPSTATNIGVLPLPTRTAGTVLEFAERDAADSHQLAVAEEQRPSLDDGLDAAGEARFEGLCIGTSMPGSLAPATVA
jgi:hypothetical protein